MFSLAGLKAKGMAAGAIALAVFAFFVRFQMVKNQRDKAVVVADTLKARHHVQKTQKKIKREEEKRLVSRRADIVKEIAKEKGEFKGLDNLRDSNDF